MSVYLVNFQDMETTCHVVKCFSIKKKQQHFNDLKVTSKHASAGFRLPLGVLDSTIAASNTHELDFVFKLVDIFWCQVLDSKNINYD